MDLEREKVEVDNLSLKTLGIKNKDDEWINFSDNSEYSEDQMTKFLEKNVDKGDTVYLHVDEDGYYHKISFDQTQQKDSKDRDFSKGKNYEREDGGKAGRIRSQVALKSAVEYVKSLDRNVEPNEVTSVAQSFKDWLKKGEI